MILTKTFETICQFIGGRLMLLGHQLLGFRVICIYSPDKQHVRAIHVALSEADLNSSMREFVDNLDSSYK